MQDDFLLYFGIKLISALRLHAIPKSEVHAAVAQVIADLRESGKLAQLNRDNLPAIRSLGRLADKNVDLVFAHDCRNQGCNSMHCVLCKHNPNKRCQANFANKYWVGDRLLARCDGEISVELIDGNGKRVTEDLSSFRIEVSILDGNRYNTKCREAGEQKLEILDACQVLLNQKQEPLLYSSTANNTSRDPIVVLKFSSGSAVVPLREMKVTESSESVLAGTKRPPFRLLVRAVHESGERLPIRPAVSEEFVVVTKRTKNLKKQEIPSLDDPIAKLNHVGKETVKKLNELRASADEVQMELNLPKDLDKIMKVKDFLQLTRLSEADGHLQQKLKSLLKLSKEKWEAACEHAKTAVQTDNRMRAWFMSNMSVGLLYSCSLGEVRTDCPVALLQNRQSEWGGEYMEVLPMEHQVPSQREQAAQISDQASKCWWEETHPGWMIFTTDDKHFESLDQIIQFTRGGSRLKPVRKQQQSEDFQPVNFRGTAEPGADSLSSEHSNVRGRREQSRLNDTTQPTMNSDRSYNTSPQDSTGKRAALADAEAYTEPDMMQGQGQAKNVVLAAEHGHNWREDPNPFRDRMHHDYQQPPSTRPPQDNGRWPASHGETANFSPPGNRNSWPEMANNPSFTPDMMGSLMSLSNLPDIGSLPSFGGMFGKGDIPHLPPPAYPDTQPDASKHGEMLPPGSHVAAGMKRKTLEIDGQQMRSPDVPREASKHRSS